MIITNKHKKSVVEYIRGSDKKIYYRVWRSGEFEVNEIPPLEDDGSILLHVDTLLRVTDEVETTVPKNISRDDETYTMGYEIKDGFEITHSGSYESILGQ